MSKVIKIIILLLIISAFGYYLGLRQRNVKVTVRDTNGSSTETFEISGNQIAGNPATDLFGLDSSSIVDKLPWYISRTAAVAAFLLMFIVIVWGTGMTTGFIYKLANPVSAWVIHKYLSIALGFLILLHMFSLLFDRSIKFSLQDILIPYFSQYKPMYLSLGIFGFYLLLLIILGSLMIRLKAARLWRSMHYLVYPLFIISLFHGYFLGTDSKTVLMQVIYSLTGLGFLLLVFYRFVLYYIRENR